MGQEKGRWKVQIYALEPSWPAEPRLHQQRELGLGKMYTRPN
jgi:hypothetical protein